MDETILLALVQDGLTTGAIYVLLAVGLLIAFSVTRVIFIPQGDLVSFAALTLASMIGHQMPGTIWLLDGLCAAALVAVAAARTMARGGAVRRRAGAADGRGLGRLAVRRAGTGVDGRWRW